MFLRHFRLRKLEWNNSLILLGLGLVMAAFPQSFDKPALAVFASHANFWTMACISLGLGRVLALWINGHWRNGTPSLRLLGSILSAAVFGAFAGNLIQTNVVDHFTWGIITYSGLMIGEIVSAWYAASDLINYRKYGV